jgi:hypothetical protein
MSDKPRLKYERPVSIDMGRVAPVLGANCSLGLGASGYCHDGGSAGSGDCSIGYGNSVVPSCNIGGGHVYCDALGSNASVACHVGSGKV